MGAILVVDDEKAIRDLLSMVLTSAGHRVLTAGNGAEAVAVYRSYPDQIDLVVTDLDMPTMDGAQEILRIRMTNPDARFICMTGGSADPCPAGVTLLKKPFAMDQLLAHVQELLRPLPRRGGKSARVA